MKRDGRSAPTMQYPMSSSVFVDVDGTLVSGGKLNAGLVDWIKRRKADGREIVLWSARGSEHAKQAVSEHKLAGLFDAVVGKPGLVVDDRGWSWIRFTRVASLDAIARQAENGSS